MSAAPPLPEGNDPHDILGVAPQATALDLKRAYVERIKVYRPDRAPAEFQRVRAAYERALEILSWSAFDDGDEHADDASAPGSAPEAAGSEPAPPVAPALKHPAIWPLVADDRMAEAQNLLEEARDSLPEDPWSYAQRFLLEEIRGRSFELAAPHLVAGINAGAPLGSWIAAVLSRREVQALAASEELALPGLVGRPERETASWDLVHARRDALLLGDRTSDLLDEVSSSAFAAAVAQTPWLRGVALEVALASVFSHPREADLLFDLHGEEPVSEGSLEEAFLIRRGLRREWESWHPKAEGVPRLARHIELAATLAPEDLLGLKLSSAVAERPREHYEACVALSSTHPHFRHVCLSALGAEGREPVDDPRLESFVQRTDEELDDDGMNSTINYAGGGFLVLTVIFFVKKGLWGLAPLAALIVTLVLWSRLDRRLYRRIVRPAVIGALLRYRCHLEDIVAAVTRHGRATNDIGRFKDDIAGDEVLQLFASALSYEVRIQEQLDRESTSGAG